MSFHFKRYEVPFATAAWGSPAFSVYFIVHVRPSLVRRSFPLNQRMVRLTVLSSLGVAATELGLSRRRAWPKNLGMMVGVLTKTAFADTLH